MLAAARWCFVSVLFVLLNIAMVSDAVMRRLGLMSRSVVNSGKSGRTSANLPGADDERKESCKKRFQCQIRHNLTGAC